MTSRSFAVVVVALMALAAACGSGSGEEAEASRNSTTTTANTSTSQGSTSSTIHHGEECAELDEIAEILGGPVVDSVTGGAEFGLTADLGFDDDDSVEAVELGYTFSGCAYSLADLDNWGEAAIVRTSSDAFDSTDLYDALAVRAEQLAAKNGFNAIDDFEHEAYKDGQGVVLLTGEAMVFVTFEPTVAGDSYQEAFLLAKLVEQLGLVATDAPLECEELAQTVSQGFGEVVDTRASGGASSIDELSFDHWACEFRFDDASNEFDGIGTVRISQPHYWDDWVTARQNSPFTRTFVEHRLNGLEAFDTGHELFVNHPDSPIRITATGDDLSLGATETRLAIAQLVAITD